MFRVIELDSHDFPGSNSECICGWTVAPKMELAFTTCATGTVIVCQQKFNKKFPSVLLQLEEHSGWKRRVCHFHMLLVVAQPSNLQLPLQNLKGKSAQVCPQEMELMQSSDDFMDIFWRARVREVNATHRHTNATVWMVCPEKGSKDLALTICGRDNW